MQFAASPDRDANRQVLGDGIPFRNTKTRAFTGAAGLGATGATNLFLVTGDVLVNVFATCSVDLAGATATIEVGVASGTAQLIAQTTATGITASKSWFDTSPALAEQRNFDPYIVGNGQTIIETVATANITGGALTYYAFWRPLSANGNLVAA